MIKNKIQHFTMVIIGYMLFTNNSVNVNNLKTHIFHGIDHDGDWKLYGNSMC